MTDRSMSAWQKRRASGLPPLTDDPERAKGQLRDFGLALLSGAVSTGTIDELHERLLDQAEAERTAGVAYLEGLPVEKVEDYGKAGPNQRVWALINKGRVFRKLAEHTQITNIISELFQEDYDGPDIPYESDEILLSSSTGNIVGQGGRPGNRHLDQRLVPFKTSYPVTVNAVVMLTDFKAENGATVVAPGSHLAPDPDSAYQSAVIPAVAPKGTVMLMDGRLLHGYSANSEGGKRIAILNYYCRPFMRTQENYCLSLRREVYDDCSDRLRALLGFKAWNTYGGVDGRHHGPLPRDSQPTTGELLVFAGESNHQV